MKKSMIVGCVALMACRTQKPDSGASSDGQDVWRADSTGFELTAMFGFGGIVPPPDGAPCTGSTATWKYDVASHEITRMGCSLGQSLDGVVLLAPSSVPDLVASLTSLKAEGPTSSCGADAPTEVLTVLGPSTPRSYTSGFYSGCTSGQGTPPFVDFQALDLVQERADGYFAACTPVDGVPPADAGATCVVATGSADAGGVSGGD
jgi:hypothetical protein